MPAATQHQDYLDLAAFDVSPEHGFLPSPDPATSLPAAFAAWDETAATLPKLLSAGGIRARLEPLPAFPVDQLREPAALRRAMMVLSYLGHAYVWGDEPPATHIPAGLAVPWCAVATRLGRPPVLSYASYALDNWRRIDPTGPVALGNIAIQQNFLGGADEDWFIAVHVDIEAKAAPLLAAVPSALAAVSRQDTAQLTEALATVGAALAGMVAVLKRMPEQCDPYVYYHRVRPYIHGWKNHPALPDGVIYEGVEALGGSAQRFRGESGAQSAIVPVIDALLGVSHADDPLRAYLREMRAYMPPAHRALIGAVETADPVRSFVEEAAPDDGALGDAYNHCIDGLDAFRTVHLEFAARYIHAQAETDSANPTEVGTAGTPFMAYLKKHRNESAAHRVNAA